MGREIQARLTPGSSACLPHWLMPPHPGDSCRESQGWISVCPDGILEEGATVGWGRAERGHAASSGHRDRWGRDEGGSSPCPSARLGDKSAAAVLVPLLQGTALDTDRMHTHVHMQHT